METVYDEHTNVSPYVVDDEREYVYKIVWSAIYGV